nr:hypothetical protein [Tanacetum cinerariifolium]
TLKPNRGSDYRRVPPFVVES